MWEIFRPGMVPSVVLILALTLLAATGTGEAENAKTRLACDESLKTSFRPDKLTKVIAVKAFRKGDPLTLDGVAPFDVATADLCMVKLIVGPGNPGPADAPSTSPGIGIEVWLPSPENWTGRLHLHGCGGFCGRPSVTAPDKIAQTPLEIASKTGAVGAVTDTGHQNSRGFAMLPDGSINRTLWKDFASRSVHEMAVKVKALAKAYYGRPHTYAYFHGSSNGGRQGLALAQNYPDDVDGIFAHNPGIYWTRVLTYDLYPQVVMQRDLADRGIPLLTTEQIHFLNSAAVSACDSTLTGQHDGFISDPASCRYDPTKDPDVLCVSDGGRNTTSACVNRIQAQAVNKMWYGQTVDGSVPDPAIDNGYHPQLSPNQLWFGIPRGSRLAGRGDQHVVAKVIDGEPWPLAIAMTQLPLTLQDPKVGSRGQSRPGYKGAHRFVNASGSGEDGWKKFTYADLARAQAEGERLNPDFGDVNTANPDLTRFKQRGGKIIIVHGMADQIVPIGGTNHYNARVHEAMGGVEGTRPFYRYFAVPGMSHGNGVGSVNGLPGVSPPADPPLPSREQIFDALVTWVERGIPPDDLVVTNSKRTLSRPLCAYPTKLVYTGGDVRVAQSYACR